VDHTRRHLRCRPRGHFFLILPDFTSFFPGDLNPTHHPHIGVLLHRDIYLLF